jgi:transposase
MSDMARGKRQKYTPEQRADAVRMVREVGNLAKVARDLGLVENTLRSWVKQSDIDDGSGPDGALTSEEREELRRLRRENRVLEMERDFLKKAAAFFAKEQDPPTR